MSTPTVVPPGTKLPKGAETITAPDGTVLLVPLPDEDEPPYGFDPDKPLVASGDWNPEDHPRGGDPEHSGRFSKAEGDQPAEEHRHELAEHAVTQAREHDQKITPTVVDIAKANGAEMAGLEFRLKTPDSLERKIRDDARVAAIDEDTAAKQITDILRYTMTFDPDNYAAGVRQAAEDLRAQGFTFASVKNTWGPDSVYQGLNTKVDSPDGYRFELQFHTPDSFQTKQEQHDSYAAVRSLDEGDPARVAANEEMRQMSADLTVPAGAETLRDF